MILLGECSPRRHAVRAHHELGIHYLKAAPDPAKAREQAYTIDMSRANSPRYPNFGLLRALHHARAIFNNAGRNPIDRLVAARHMGYMGKSGASDKALGSLAHYGLIERVGKGEIRVTRTALDILHPDKPTDRKRALVTAAFRPSIFMELRKRFPKRHVSVEAIQSYLRREHFLDRAIGPLTSAYIETVRFLEQEKATIDNG